jgi:hypothetical protein
MSDPGYQIKFAELVDDEAALPARAIGLIVSQRDLDTIVSAHGRN